MSKIPPEPNKLLAQLLDYGADNSVSFIGYVGPQAKNKDGDDVIHFYPDIFNLTKYIIIKTKDILHYKAIPDAGLPFEAIVIWVHQESKVTFIRVKQPEKLTEVSSEVSILAGRLQLVLGKGESSIGYMKPPPICTK